MRVGLRNLIDVICGCLFGRKNLSEWGFGFYKPSVSKDREFEKDLEESRAARLP
jgi:hypothetical protein